MRKVTPHIDLLEMLDSLCEERADVRSACAELRSQILSGGLELVDVTDPADQRKTKADAINIIDSFAAGGRANVYQRDRAHEIGTARLLFETTFTIQNGCLKPLIDGLLRRQSPLEPAAAHSSPRNKGGRKRKWDWGPAEDALRNRLEDLGDFDDPDQIDEWNSQAAAERFLAEKVSTTGVEPAESLVREKVVQVVANWRASKAEN